jgi:hypothetical protein
MTRNDCVAMCSCVVVSRVALARPIAQDLALLLRRTSQQAKLSNGLPRKYQVVLFGHSDAAALGVLNALACASMDCVSKVFVYTEGCPLVLSPEATEHFRAQKAMLWGVNVVHFQVRSRALPCLPAGRAFHECRMFGCTWRRTRCRSWPPPRCGRRFLQRCFVRLGH